MPGTIVFYNGIFLQDCETLEFRQVIEMDESKTDHLWSKFRIRVASTLCRTIKPEIANTLTGALNAEERAVLVNNEMPEHGSLITPMPFRSTTSDAVSAAHLEHNQTNDNLKDLSLAEHHLVVAKFLKEPRKDFWMSISAQDNTDITTTASNVPVGPPDAAGVGAGRRLSDLSVLGATGMTEAEALALDPNAFTVDNAKYLQASKILRYFCMDSANGPKPTSVSVQKILGGRSMRIEFEIEVCVFVGPFSTEDSVRDFQEAAYKAIGARKTIGVASNRWSVTESLDENWKTTHAVKGQLIVRDHTYKPHAQRMLTVPWMFPYAKIMEREFYTDPSGLTLNYRHVFGECGDAPPAGVIDWSGKYSEQALGGGKHYGSISVKVRGTVAPPRGLDAAQYKSLLITQAFKIMSSRLTLTANVGAVMSLPGQRAVDSVLQEAIVIEKMNEPEIEVKATVLHNGNKELTEVENMSQFRLRLTNMGSPIIANTGSGPYVDPTYNRLWWPIPSSFTWDWKTVRDLQTSAAAGSKPGSYFDCYFQSPEWEWHGIPVGMDIPDRIDSIPPSHPYIHTDVVTAGVNADYSEYLNFNFRGYGEDGRPLPEVEHDSLSAPPQVAKSPSALNTSIQQGGFAYLTYDSKTTIDHSSGVVFAPLSKPRDSIDPIPFPDPSGSGSGSMPTPKDTGVAIRLHAPVAYRDYTVIATRIGDWPKVPYPQEKVRTATTGTETLISKREVVMTPKPGPDDNTMIYGVECHWRYALSRPPGYSNSIGEQPLRMPLATESGGDRSVIEVGANPMYRASPSSNQLPLAGFYDQSGASYTLG